MSLFLGSSNGCAQKILNRNVSVKSRREPLSSVLRSVAESGKFYFSYNSDILPGDSLVSFTVEDKSVKYVLDQLLGEAYQFRESGNYLIILRKAREKVLTLSGHVFDTDSRLPADYVSVYSRKLLLSALTDDQGYFRLRIRDSEFPIELTVSKIGYGDTTVVVDRKQTEPLRLGILPKAVLLDAVTVRNAEGAGSWLGRLFISGRLRAQSRNISEFFVSLPYQASLTPGLGTHGKMSGQVVNKFSLNILGGYTAGVKGLEMAGGFNISKTDVKYLQIAGIFNIVSGRVQGVQLAGLHNHVVDSLAGIQASGFSSVVMQEVKGVQLSGFLSRAKGPLKGVQMSGVVSLAGSGVRGVQISGAVNRASHELKGIQVSGLANLGAGVVRGVQLGPVNYARNLKGVQFGIVNIADSSAGCSIGLINIVKNGSSNISLYASDIAPFNLAWKMGTSKFYSILMAGSNAAREGRVQTFGVGFGREFRLGNKLSLGTEFISQNVYLGSWENLPVMYRAQTPLSFRINRRFSLVGGPAYSVFNSDTQTDKPGYKSFPLKNYPLTFTKGNTSGWLGWQLGISWRY